MIGIDMKKQYFQPEVEMIIVTTMQNLLQGTGGLDGSDGRNDGEDHLAPYRF